MRELEGKKGLVFGLGKRIAKTSDRLLNFSKYFFKKNAIFSFGRKKMRRTIFDCSRAVIVFSILLYEYQFFILGLALVIEFALA